MNRSKTISANKESTEPRAAQIAAHHTRDRKELLSPEEVLQRHRELAAQYGHQADRVVAQARQHGQCQMPEPEVQAQQAVTYARDHLFERSAVQDRRAILETALVRGMGETTYAQVRQEFERRIEAGEFREVSHMWRWPDSTPPPRCFAWSVRSLAGCRKAIGATTAIRCWSRRKCASPRKTATRS